MATLAELSILLTAKDQASGTFQAVEKNAGGMGSAIGGIAKTVATVGAVAGVALGGLAVKSVMAASDMAEAQNKVNVVFGEGAEAINAFASTAARSVGLSRTEALNATGTFGNMFTQLGIGEEASADMSTQMVKLAADFGSFHNADISDVIAAQTSAFRGEYDAVQRFVPTINAANVEQKALEMTGKATTKMLTAQEKALAVQTLLMEGAGKATGDFANTSTGMANSMRIIKASISDATVQIGERLLPVVTPMIAAFAQAIPGAVDVAISVFDRLGQVIAPLIAAGQGLFDIFVNRDFTGGLFGLQEDSGVVTFLFQVRDALASLGGIVSSVVSSFDSLSGIEGTISDLANNITEAVFSALPQIYGAFLEWAEAGIRWAADILPPLMAQLLEVASGVLAWALDAGSQFMAFLIDFWLPAFLRWAIEMAPVLLELLGGLAIQIINWIGANGPTIATKLIEWAFAFVGWVLTDALPMLIPALFKLLFAIVDWVLNEAVPALVSAAFNMGRAIIEGILSGIGGLFDLLLEALWDAIHGAFNRVLDRILGHSPSKLFMKIGESITQGIVAGIGKGITVPVALGGIEGAGRSALAGAGAGGASIIVNVYGSVTTEDNLVDALHRALLLRQDRNASLGFR